MLKTLVNKMRSLLSRSSSLVRETGSAVGQGRGGYMDRALGQPLRGTPPTARGQGRSLMVNHIAELSCKGMGNLPTKDFIVFNFFML